MCQISITQVPPTVAAADQFFLETYRHSRRERFHATVSSLPLAELEGLAQVRTDRLNVYGFEPGSGELVGVASAVVWAPHAAEVAVWVADRCQQQGLGTALTLALRDRLPDADVTEVWAFLEPSNPAALALWSKVFSDPPLAACDVTAESCVRASVRTRRPTSEGRS
jgi:ribosomal protein S18 acetylase RimI-like enzyme